jgi:hypothetical protein
MAKGEFERGSLCGLGIDRAIKKEKRDHGFDFR